MVIFGLKIMTEKACMDERQVNGEFLMDLNSERLKAEAERDSADRHVERLLYNGTDLILLWAAVRDCGVENQVRVVYNRLRPKEKGASSG